MTPEFCDPTTVRLSRHFLLSDFLGNHSVYSRGYRNGIVMDDTCKIRLDNAEALCVAALEPLLEEFGPMSVSYGYISPELSRLMVKYQDPDIPSHHRWDLGAAADICLHNWVAGNFRSAGDLYLPDSVRGAPIGLAHYIDSCSDIPYSRLITYSESPYLCLAVARRELEDATPRKAFYENRYQGREKAKPDYRQYSSVKAKSRALEDLQNFGLAVDWRGKGYPTYHGGGFQQYQHMRVSAYTMVSDWLFDLKSISEGGRNTPSLNLDSVQDAFAAAGIVYDGLLDLLDLPRASIIQGYVSHTNANFDPANDWRGKFIRFKVVLPEDVEPEYSTLAQHPLAHGVEFGWDNGALVVNLEVDYVLNAGD